MPRTLTTVNGFLASCQATTLAETSGYRQPPRHRVASGAARSTAGPTVRVKATLRAASLGAAPIRGNNIATETIPDIVRDHHRGSPQAGPADRAEAAGLPRSVESGLRIG